MSAWCPGQNPGPWSCLNSSPKCGYPYAGSTSHTSLKLIDWLIYVVLCTVREYFTHILRQFQNCKITPPPAFQTPPKEINALVLGGTGGLYQCDFFCQLGIVFHRGTAPPFRMQVWLFNNLIKKCFKSCYMIPYGFFPIHLVCCKNLLNRGGTLYNETAKPSCGSVEIPLSSRTKHCTCYLLDLAWALLDAKIL